MYYSIYLQYVIHKSIPSLVDLFSQFNQLLRTLLSTANIKSYTYSL